MQTTLPLFAVLIGLLITVHFTNGKTVLMADGVTDTYKLINSVLGGTAVEVPDCAHPAYGPHITQRFNDDLNRNIFVFHAHVQQDNDGCSNFDRQRTEIKTYGPSPTELKGYEGETVTLSWNIRINSQFQPSTKFTHIHQIKAKGGDDGSPILTITPRKRSSGNILEIIYVGRDGTKTVLKTDDFSKYVGKWIHIKEELTYGRNGKLNLVFSRTDNGQEIMTLTNSNIDLWRDGAEFVRPKWGIYRSLLETSSLRDENVFFDSFCLSKGTSNKCT